MKEQIIKKQLSKSLTLKKPTGSVMEGREVIETTLQEGELVYVMVQKRTDAITQYFYFQQKHGQLFYLPVLVKDGIVHEGTGIATLWQIKQMLNFVESAKKLS